LISWHFPAAVSTFLTYLTDSAITCMAVEYHTSPRKTLRLVLWISYDARLDEIKTNDTHLGYSESIHQPKIKGN